MRTRMRLHVLERLAVNRHAGATSTAGVIGTPATESDGWAVKASAAAGPAETSNAALVTAPEGGTSGEVAESV